MDIHKQEHSLLVSIDAKNEGKLRFKKRKDRFGFGEPFPTRECPFDDEVYLEWQIGYDVSAADVDAGKATTRLNRVAFTGSSGRIKYPYELSELLWLSVDIDLLNKSDVERLRDEIIGYNHFLDAQGISVERHQKVEINGISFEEADIKLPTFFMVKTTDDTQIEISIQKQQYAAGVQPMIYFCIPLKAFSNAKDIVGRPSTRSDCLSYIVNSANVSNLVDLIRVFGMASKRHNHDIVQILKTIIGVVS